MSEDIDLDDPDLIAAVREAASHIKALATVAYLAKAFWETTDDAPLIGLTADQGELWDAICDAIAHESEWAVDE